MIKNVDHLKHFLDIVLFFDIRRAIRRMSRHAMKHGFITTVHMSMNASQGLLIIQFISLDLFIREVISRIKPEHQAPVKFLWRVTSACCSKRLPYVWYWGNDTIMNMRRSRDCITRFA